MRTVTYNGLVSTDPLFGRAIVQSIDRPVFPGAMPYSIHGTGLDGVLYHGRDRLEVIVSFNLAIRAKTYEERAGYIDNVRAWLDTGEVGPLIFSDEPHKQYMAVLVSEIRIAEILKNGTMLVMMMVPSSHAEAVTTDAGHSMDNIISNGNFGDGTTGWVDVAATATLSAADNILSITGTGAYAYAIAKTITTAPVVSGKKVFVRAKLEVTNALCTSFTAYVYGSTTVGTQQAVATVSTPVNGTTYTVSNVVTLPSDAAGDVVVAFRHNYADAATATGKVMEVKEVTAIDMTADGIPTLPASQMDTLTQTWFDDEANVWDYPGTMKTPVQITATMVSNSASLKITLEETGEYILLTTALVIGDVVVIDTNKHTVTLNGVDAREYVSFNSTYFSLPPDAVFTLIPTPADTTITTVFRERYK